MFYCASVLQEILWPVDVCRTPLLGSCGIVESTCLYCLPYYSQFIVLVAVLMFLLLHVVTIIIYCHCFLALIALSFVADAALEDVGAVLAIKSPPA